MDPSADLEGSDEEITSAGKVLQMLTQAWVNEKYCPELLKHESDLVDCMMDQIKQMEANISTLERDDFRLVPHQMEVDRIRYVISSYLRTRLEKIEMFAEYLIKNDYNTSNEEERLMSRGEFAFAENYYTDVKEHLFKEALQYMPELIREPEGTSSQMEVTPNLNSTVFIKMVKTCRGVLICDQVVELTAGSRHLLPYKDVRHLIRDGSAFLI
ncbi:UNVERIFIED_CONTAM: hypothetical protein PYX00_003202 [Menopon gallinae]|uniref:DNA replication complex GINS protein SLD5 n=1 Tax=Menopon gallinae TaxID=328185 RepID=A0AAW2HZ04_9NEOP